MCYMNVFGIEKEQLMKCYSNSNNKISTFIKLLKPIIKKAKKNKMHN